MSRRDCRQASNETTRRTFLTQSVAGVAVASTLEIVRADHILSDKALRGNILLKMTSYAVSF